MVDVAKKNQGKICPKCKSVGTLAKLEEKRDVLSQQDYFNCWVCDGYFLEKDVKD